MSSSAKYARARHNLGLFLKFGLVGGSGVLVNGLVTLVMNKLNGGPQNANRALFPLVGDFSFSFSNLVWIVAFLVANLTNFQLNRTWTFQSGRHAGWWKEFWPFFAVGSVAAFVGFFLKEGMTNPTSPIYLPEPYFHSGEHEGLRAREYWSQIIAIFLTLPINFVVNKLWTFRAVRGKGPGERTDVMVAPVVAPEKVSDHEASLGEVRDGEGRVRVAERTAHDSVDEVERD